ncbi:helix-turn-helix transcriptional regulator [Methylocapsa sp. D3K7]|uniref:helix-turn-helix transcriptional regulator n=1 Tax=Methylocapsa sp. D3K7 TaxID=3041435 RepID=UPI00244EBCA8|nr:helix-turn-helix transcriptional regulator [Methylocapsa sp. D3K7]WGJ13775.1 helix-turn-helix transcriptional regulator [Methylocapsa sp. D3K7]
MTEEISGRQIAAARALLGLSQGELASKAKISTPTLMRMEAKFGEPVGLFNNIAAVCAVLELAGIEFSNGDEPGVRLRKTLRGDSAASIPVEKLTSENDE